jgi:hypothetical protein
VGNSASVAAIVTAQKAITTNATTTQPTHPEPAPKGALLNVKAASFLRHSGCGPRAQESIWVL